nr:MAG TPA: hypothetical protein [Caudoviricetes sp.]
MNTREYIDNVRSFLAEEKQMLRKLCSTNSDKSPESFSWRMKQNLERGRFTMDGVTFCPRKIAHILMRAAKEEGVTCKRTGRTLTFSIKGSGLGGTL